MKLRVNGNEIFGPTNGHFLNKDDYLESFNFGEYKGIIITEGFGSVEVNRRFYPKYDFQVSNGKITGIKTSSMVEYISLTENNKVNDFVKQNPDSSSLISNLRASKGNLDVLRRVALSKELSLGNEKYNFPDETPVFTGENTFGIDEVKSKANDGRFSVKHVESGNGYVFEKQPWFNLGSKTEFHKIFGFPILEIQYNVFEDEKTAKTFKDVKDVPQFLEKLDKVPFKGTIKTILDKLPKDKFITGLKEEMSSIEGLSKEDIDYLGGLLNQNLPKSIPPSTYITNYWFPKGDKMRPYMGIMHPGKGEVKIEIKNDRIEGFKKSLVAQASFLEEKEYNKPIIKWCQVIGKKYGYCK